MTTTHLQRDTFADTMVASIHAMAAVDLDVLRRTVHPAAVDREALAEPPDTRGHGPEAFIATARWLTSAFADLAFAIDTVVVEGDLVVTHGTMSGRQTGELRHLDPRGQGRAGVRSDGQDVRGPPRPLRPDARRPGGRALGRSATTRAWPSSWARSALAVVPAPLRRGDVPCPPGRHSVSDGVSGSW